MVSVAQLLRGLLNPLQKLVIPTEMPSSIYYYIEVLSLQGFSNKSLTNSYKFFLYHSVGSAALS